MNYQPILTFAGINRSVMKGATTYFKSMHQNDGILGNPAYFSDMEYFGFIKLKQSV